MNLNTITGTIIGKAIEIHKTLGPGLLESTYQECLLFELEKEGFSIQKEKLLPLIYKDLKLEQAYRIDLVVNNQVVIELKCVEALAPVHSAQILTYMKLGNFKLGLLINFHSKLLKDGIRRFIN